jgi:Na+(H+)/acetate symporter ActP
MTSGLDLCGSNASEKEKVWVGRVSTIVLMIIAALLALCAGERAAGLQYPAADRGRHGAAVHPALVLVANQRRTAN